MSTVILNKHNTRSSNEFVVYLELLEAYWRHCDEKICGESSDLSEVVIYVDLIEQMLEDEKFITKLQSGQVVHFLFENAIKRNIFQRMYEWHEYLKVFQLDSLKSMYIRFYERLISSPCIYLFLHRQFLLPMMCSLHYCSRCSSVQIENILLQTLHAVCVALHQHTQPKQDLTSLDSNPSDLFWSICLNPVSFLQPLSDRRQSFPDISPSPSPPAKQNGYSNEGKVFKSAPSLPSAVTPPKHKKLLLQRVDSLCDLLVSYVHRDGSLSWLSRDALLLLASSSCTNSTAGHYITRQSNFCEVLTTDMVVLFNDMPRSLVRDNAADKWPLLLQGIEAYSRRNGSLHKFLDHFEFCCSVLDVSNVLVKETMLSCVYRGFLIPVLVPALTQASSAEVATVTMYLDAVLCKSNGSTMLPFLLRFLLSELPSNSSDCWLWNGGDLQLGVTQALEQSFPGPEASTSFFGRQGSVSYSDSLHSPGQAQPLTFIDVLLQRVYYCDTLVGVASLSLLDTILEFYCEDIVFDLVLKYIIPFGDVSSYKKMSANPNTFIRSADQFLALIPPYSSIRKKQREQQTNKLQNGVIDSIPTQVNGVINGDTRVSSLPFLCEYIKKSQELVKQRRLACVYWRFTYDFNFPTTSQVSGAHLNEEMLLPLPQEGHLIHLEGSGEPVSSENQWELEECIDLPDASQTIKNTEDVVSSNSILARLDRFSALLEKPSSTKTASVAKKGTVRMKRKIPSRYCRRSCKSVVDDIKRTSSLYDISFTDMDLERQDENGCDSDKVNDISECYHSTTRSQTSQISSSNSAASLAQEEPSIDVFVEPSPVHLQDAILTEVTDLSERLSGSLQQEEAVSSLMKCLKRMASPVNDSVDDLEAQLLQLEARLENLEGAGEELKDMLGSKIKSSDSGLGSIDQQHYSSGQPIWQSTTGSILSPTSSGPKKKTSDTARSFSGPFLTVMLQLVSRMPVNHLYVNLMVTSIMSKLLSYPLPLVRSLLFTHVPEVENRDTISDPPTCQLYAILLTVRQWFDCYINFHFSQHGSVQEREDYHSNFSALCASARSAIFQQMWNHGPSTTAPFPSKRNNSDDSRKMSFFDSLRKLSSSDSRFTTVRKTVSTRRNQAGFKFSDSTDLFYQIKDDKLRGVLISYIVFEEFCQELAALCLEHCISL